MTKHAENLMNLLREKVQNRDKARILAEEYNALLQKELDLMVSLNQSEKNEENQSKLSIADYSKSLSESNSSSSSSSSSDSSSSEDSSTESSSSEDTSSEHVKQPLTNNVKMPSDLRSGKRKAVSKMLEASKSPKHMHFDEEETQSSIPVPKVVHNLPNVLRTETRLYNPKSIYTPNQLKRVRAKRPQIKEQDNQNNIYQEYSSNAESESFEHQILGEEDGEQIFDEADMNGETVISEYRTAENHRNYENLEPCTSPKKGTVIAFKKVELSSAYTPEISAYNEARILSVKTIASEIIVELQMIKSKDMPIDPADSWSSIKASPNYHYDDVEEYREHRGKFEIELDEDIQTEQLHDPSRPLIIEWSALIDVKIIS